jgi:hypothetical protein
MTMAMVVDNAGRVPTLSGKVWEGVPLSKQEAEDLQKLIGTVTFRYKRTERENKITYHRALQTHLLQMRERDGFRALGYTCLSTWLEEQFPQSRPYYQKILKNADFHIKLYGTPFVALKSWKKGETKADDVYQVEEGVTRAITTLPEECWREVWDIAIEIAREKTYPPGASRFHQGKITGVISTLAVKVWKERNAFHPSAVPYTVAYQDPRRLPRDMHQKLEDLLKTDNHIYLLHMMRRMRDQIEHLGYDPDHIITKADFPEDTFEEDDY